jgi:hypothetical protein
MLLLTTKVDLFLQNYNKKIFIFLFYTYTVISKISNLMQKCVTIFSNIRKTHKYGNILLMKIEKYNYCMHIYVKIYPQLETNRHHTSAKIY